MDRTFSIFHKKLRHCFSIFFILSPLIVILLGQDAFCVDKDILLLMDATYSKERAAQLDDRYLLSSEKLSKTSPLWPIQTFLAAEVYSLRGDKTRARDNYKVLVQWAASDPYMDGSGGSGVVSIALWRWVMMLSDRPVKEDIVQLIEYYEKIKDAPLMSKMFHGAGHATFFTSLPQIQEETFLHLAKIAIYGEQIDRACYYFIDYLKHKRTSQLNALGTKLKKELFPPSSRLRDQMNLEWGKRLYDIKSYLSAQNALTSLKTSTNLSVRSEALLYLAHVKRKRGVRSEASALYEKVYRTSPVPELAQKALYSRALANLSGKGRKISQFKKDVLLLEDKYPQGSYTDKALYQLAAYYKDSGNLETALIYYKKVRTYYDKHMKSKKLDRDNRIDSAHLVPAMELYGQGSSANKNKAFKLLKELMEKRPHGPMRYHALFWLGRISEEKGKSEAAKGYFEQIIKDSPYQYYAIRARMHLRQGKNASLRVWPDSVTMGELRADFKKSSVDSILPNSTAYHRRIKEAIDTELYQKTLRLEEALRKEFPSQRVENIHLKKIQSQKLAGVVILQSLRQDALTADESDTTPENKLKIAGAVGQRARDYTLSVMMLILAGEYYQHGIPVQQDKRFLATAYPTVYKSEIMKASKRYNVPPELLYSIMRRESIFYPLALSTTSAMGFFQFLPSTFRALDKRWGLLRNSGFRSREAFLFNPHQNINLGARWFRQELLDRYKKYGEKDVIFAIMDHNAGYSTVKRWHNKWKKRGLDKDIEFSLQTIPFGQTRIFTPRVLADMTLVKASDMFE